MPFFRKTIATSNQSYVEEGMLSYIKSNSKTEIFYQPFCHPLISWGHTFRLAIYRSIFWL